MERHEFKASGLSIRITISVGVATCPTEGVESPGDMVRLADQALYRAKQAGRNRVA